MMETHLNFLLCEIIQSVIALNFCSTFCDGKALFLLKYVSFIYTPALFFDKEKFF